VVPSHCNLLISAISDADYVYEHIDFWSDVYGFKMNSMRKGIRDDVAIRHIPEDCNITQPFTFLQLPLSDMRTSELSFTAPFELTLDRAAETVDAFIIYFDTFFATSRTTTISKEARAETWTGLGNSFTTGPFGKETHWKQGVLMLAERNLDVKAGQQIRGQLTYEKSKENRRELEIEVSWEVDGANQRQSWCMRRKCG